MAARAVADPDPLATVLGAALKTLPEGGRCWPDGPIVLAKEYKRYGPDLERYLAWVTEVETRIGDTAEAAQRLRMLHYGYRAKGVLFDLVLDSNPMRIGSPMTLRHASQATLDGLIGAGSLSTWHGDSSGPVRPPVEASHVWVCADAILNGFGASADGLAAITDPYGAISWTADLASWWELGNQRRLEMRKAALDAGQTWQEPTDPATLAMLGGLLDEAITKSCVVDDILGDMDGIILMPEIPTLPPGPAPLAALLRRYYGPSDPAHGGSTSTRRDRLHSDNRFHLFVARAKPAIPFWPDESTGGVILDVDAHLTIRAHIRSCAYAFLLTLRMKGQPWWLYVASPWDGLSNNVRIIKSIDEDLDSPWGSAMLDIVTARFTRFLREGLATGGWHTASWPQGEHPLDPYGGHALRLGDSDSARRYGGVTRPADPANTYVALLQERLARVGFSTRGDPIGEYGPGTAGAVREFQVASSFSMVRNVKADAAGNPVARVLEPTLRRHQGPVNGCLDRDTAGVLNRWLSPENAQHSVNPAVVTAYRMQGDLPVAPVATNIWGPAEVTDPALGVYAADHLERYAIPAARRLPGDPGTVALGRYAVPESGTAGPGGPLLSGAALWPEAELTAQTLVPPWSAPPTPAELAVVRVVRAVAEAGAAGRFDAVDTRGRDRLRIGPLRWGLAPDGTGELPALLALYKARDPGGYARDFGRHGIEPEAPWDPAGRWAADGQARRVGRLAMYGLRDAAGAVHPGELLPLGVAGRSDFADAYLLDHLRGWHAVHRLVMALRTTTGLRHVMWEFTVDSLRRLLARPWRRKGPPVPPIPPGPLVADGSGGLRDASLGEVFTSERTVAALLRWHVVVPAEVVGADGAADRLRSVFTAVYGAGPRTLGPPTGDEADARQAALAQRLVSLAPTSPPSFPATVATAVDYRGADGVALSGQGGSFPPPP